MDFITGLPLSTEGFNTILTVVDRLSKERHYIPCTAGEEGTSAEETAKLFLRWVYRTHGLPDSIVSDRGTQFVSLLWKSLCARLGISNKLSTAYHPQTDGQTERAN
jgi:transposase InsO family protein